jgi:hypothetical protein
VKSFRVLFALGGALSGGKKTTLKLGSLIAPWRGAGLKSAPAPTIRVKAASLNGMIKN